MKNSKYWQERFKQLEDAQNGLAQMSFKDIETQYRTAQKELEGKINTWYQRLAKNNNISMAEARKLLSADELAEFKWTLSDYIKYGKENALNGQWIKQLENASAKFHISKYQALMIDTHQSFEQLFGKQLDTITGAMGKIYENGYYRTAYELQKGVGIGFDVGKINREEVEKVLSKPWAADGKNFSERIWGNKEKLINEVHNELTQNIITGADPQKAIDALAKKMNTSKSNAGRLVMTEEAYFSSVAQGKSYNDLGVEQYEVLATLDDLTSEICQNLDGKVFDMKDYQAGVTAPPFHVYCRSTTVPHLDEEIWGVGERAARGEDGKTYYVPDNIAYPEWKEKFVNGGDKEGLTEVDKSEESEPAKSKNKIENKFDDAKAYSEVQDEYERNATPQQGSITFDENFNKELHKSEIAFADWLHNYYGGDIKLLNEKPKEGIKMPDFIWNGKFWDLKTATTEKSANGLIRKGIKQIESNPGGIFLDYGDRDISIDVLLSVIEERMQWYRGNGLDIMIVRNSEVIKVLRYEKRT